jgi:hypothetical protein
MKPTGWAMIALAIASFLAPPALAGGPAAASGPGPIRTAATARQALRARGLIEIRHLWHIGDYWESEVEDQGRSMVAYLFDNGTLWLRHYPRSEMREAFGGPAPLSGSS